MTTQARLIQVEDARKASEVHVTHGGETVVTTPEKAFEIADALVERHGAGMPIFAFFAPVEPSLVEVPALLPEALPISDVSVAGAVRSTLDLDAARAAGFAPARPLYERGTRVNSLGVENARRERQQWEAMPLVEDYTDEFTKTIYSENRQDRHVDGYALRMTTDGRIGEPGSGNPAEHVTSTAFAGLVQRLGYGGASYLEKCNVRLRQQNVNAWGVQLSTERELREESGDRATREASATEGEMVLRTRNSGDGAREIFAAVTPSYTSFDVDRVSEAFGIAMKGTGARGRVTYDGDKARFEAFYHSTVQPEDYVAGEFFRAGIIVRTDDTGGGSIRGSAVVWQNLCLNLIIIDQAQQDLFRIRHIGSVQELARRFREGIVAGQKKLEHFRKAWGFAVSDDVLAASRVVQPEIPIPVSQALPGLFRGILERELVPVRGRREENVKHLVSMVQRDTSAATTRDYLSRAAVVNAFTRFAHEVNQDPWQEDEIQRAAGSLLYGRRGQAPAVLPWLAE